MNLLKRLLFAAYLGYLRYSPSALGKGFLTRCIWKLGLARYRIGGSAFDLNPCAWIDRTLITGKTHDAFVQEIIAQRLGAGGVLIDIGANIGVVTLAAARLRDVVVYSFEPSPRELGRLYRNLVANRVNNVVVFPLALGRTSSWLELALAGELNPGNNSFVPHAGVGHQANIVRCRCEPFSALFAPELVTQIKVVKLDVEGFEMEVLAGMSASLELMASVVFVVEVTRSFLANAGSSAEELYRFFESRGFTARCGLQSVDQWDEAFSR